MRRAKSTETNRIAKGWKTTKSHKVWFKTQSHKHLQGGRLLREHHSAPVWKKDLIGFIIST